MNQASRKSWLVPVLPAACQPGSSALLRGAGEQRLLHHGVHHRRRIARLDRRWPSWSRLRGRTAPCRRRCGRASTTCGETPSAAIGERRIGGRPVRAARLPRCRARSRHWARASRRCRAGARCAPRSSGRLPAPSRTETVLSDIGQRLGQRHRAEIFVAVILRLPALDVERRVLRGPCPASGRASIAVR